MTSLLFENELGGFSADGTAYVLRLRRRGDRGHRLPPRPWINVVANERCGFLVSETGAGYTWSGNSREHRLTPWSNDPVTDPHGEAVYLRDDTTGEFWSPLPGPAPADADYEVRHGFGYSTFRLHAGGIEQRVICFVPRHDPVKIVRMRLRDSAGLDRRLSLFAFARLVLGVLPEETAPFLRTEAMPDPPAIAATHAAAGDQAQAVAFAALRSTSASAAARWTADRAAFLGPEGDMGRPLAVAGGGNLDGRTGAGLDPCAALQLSLTLPPHGETDIWFLLGEGGDRAQAEALLRRYSSLDALASAEQEVRAFWREGFGRLRVTTPDPALDLLMNGWLPYQVLSCRVWARSALYQSGGAFGFRDQLQDAAAWIYLRPELTRAQILLHAAHQFVEGDVLHWWHPPAGAGIRTRFVDDLLWLPYVTAYYVGATGELELLDERVPFLEARALEPGEDEAYLRPRLSGETGSLYEHCCRAIERSLAVGAHGLPLFGTGDWNDGMNRVGREGRGESVWMAFFLGATLDAFAPICARRGDEARAGRYREWRDRLERAANKAGWDGAWYRRGFYDDGTPLGSAADDECRIDALVQAWAVLAGMAPAERARSAIDAVERHLVSEEGRLVRLLAPPFERTPHDPGYIKGYAPGVRENGGQYTHAALWYVRALAELGRRDRAERLFSWFNPIHRTRTPEEMDIYRLEPYVVAADIYGVPPHLGRGGWSWYTGSAGWMYRVALETILGFALEDGRAIRLRPRIPDRWPGFAIEFVWPAGGRETSYEIRVENPTGRAEAVCAAMMDGMAGSLADDPAARPPRAGAIVAPADLADRSPSAARFPLLADGGRHRIEVTLGPARSAGR